MLYCRIFVTTNRDNNIKTMNRNRKYAETLSDAKRLFKIKTGTEYNNQNHTKTSGCLIFKLKTMKTNKRKYFVGTYMEWLNL